MPPQQHGDTDLSKTGFVGLYQVLRVFPVSRSSWWAGIQTGKYPRGYKLGKRCTGWKCEDIRRLISATGRNSHGAES